MATKMNEAQKFIHVSKYSRWIESENRREISWEETSSRYLDFMRKRFEEKVPKKIWKLLDERVKGLGVAPSMRAVAMAGPALEENNIMGYNCSFVPFLDLQAPVELFYILMCGTGVGLSVENFFISQMPEVAKWAGDGAGVYVVEDSREGWANSLKAGLENWFAGKDIEFDYSRIRARGTRLKKTGGRASGPEPLKRLHDFCRDTICKAQGRKLNSLEWLDIANMIGDVVVVGGVRRSSEISFSDLNDNLIRNAKNGAFPQYRCNSNNSAVYFNKPDAATFLREWLTLVESGTGERGIFNVHAIKNMLPQRREFRWDMRSNPCFAPGTLIQTRTGHFPIEQLVGKSVEIWDGFKWVMIDNFRVTGENQPVLKVTFHDGSEEVVTPYHTVVLESGERIKAHELVPGMKVKFSDAPCTHGITKANGAYLKGFLVGDGTSINNERPILFLYDTKYSCETRLIESAKQIPAGTAVTNSVEEVSFVDSGTNRRKLMQGLSVRKGELLPWTTDYKQRLPSEIFAWDLDSKLEFIAGVMDADGTANDTSKNGFRYQISSIHKRWLQDFQALLKTIGVWSKLSLMKKGERKDFGPERGGVYQTQNCYRLTISQSNSIRLSEQVKFSRLTSFADRTMAYSLAPKYNTVVSIEADGVEEKVYCCTVERAHALGLTSGFYWGNCGEIILRPFSFCNLSEVIIRADDEFDDVVEKVEAAVWLGAMQATFTKFPYIRPDFKKNCEEERLLGVSLTGQMDNPALMTPEKLTILKKYAIKTAKKASAALGINLSAAITTGKPSGCRPWYALTTTDNGILTMEDLFNDHPEFEQWAEYSGEAKVHYQGGLHPISKTYANGLSPIVKIDLTYGMEIKSTPNHKWLVQNRGWVEAEHLEPGDVVTVTPNIYNKTTHASFDSFVPESIKMRSDYTPILQPAQMNNDIAWLLGYLWGDGAMSPTKYKIRFIDENKYNLIKAQRIVKENFGVDSTINKASGDRNAYALDIPSKALWHWFIRNDAWKYFNDSIDIIPKCVRTSSKDDIISFFAGIIDADGWCGIDYSKDNLGRVTLTTAYEEFSKHVQHVGWAIGLAFGRSANVHGDDLQKQKKMFLMGLSKHYTAADSFAVLVKNSNKLSLFEKSPRFCGWSFAQPASKIKKNQVAGTVVAKTLAAPELTYDVEIPDVHAYTAGSIVSHNTVSQLADCASGAHPRYAKYYIRRYRLNSSDPVYRLMKDQGVKFFPENGQGPDAVEEKRKQWIAKGRTEEEAKMLVPDWDESQVMTWVCEFPMKAPTGAIVRSQVSAIEQLEWYLKIMKNWCEHNQSISIYVRRDEWMKVGAWVYDHFDEVVGVSFIPYDDSDVKYKLAPYEEITKEEYEKRAKEFPKLDYSNLAKYELADETTAAQLLACTGGACELA